MIVRRHADPERSPARGRLPATLLLAALGGLAAVAVAASGSDLPRASNASLARALVRPAVLPPAWARYAAAQDAGDPAAAAAALETVLGVVPGWDDGHVALAWATGLEVAVESDAPAVRLALLLDAVARLDEVARSRVAGRPTAAAEMWLAAATLVEIRAREDAALRDAWQDRFATAAVTDRTPLDTAHRLTAAAAAAVQDLAVERRLAFVTQRSLAAVIRTGDLARAEAVRQSAIRRLEGLPPAPECRAAIEALQRLGDLTRFADADHDPDRLAGDGALDEVRRALLEARRR